jgi:hypothetical protein
VAALLGLALLLVVIACGGDASSVSLADLVMHEGRYEGKTVAVSGRVRPFADEDGPTYYVLEDAASNRVMLLPAATAAPHDGAEVCVTGKFAFEEGRGRTLTVDGIEEVSEGACRP